MDECSLIRLIFKTSIFVCLTTFGISELTPNVSLSGVGKRAPEEGDQCDPTEERLHSLSSDKTAFLICDSEQKVFQLHRCDSNDGVSRIFDAKRQQCIAAHEENHWLLMAAPNNATWKKVGDSCVVNRECWDGMYCTGGMCSCYLNYVQVNSMCVRVSSTCPGSTYYPEHVHGKPKICSLLDTCPPGYICRAELGGEQGFCCLALATEVCGSLTAHVINGRPVSCYDTSASSELCPDGHICQMYPLANRRYCCEKENDTFFKVQETSTAPAISTKATSTQSRPDSIYCSPPNFPHLHDGNPLVCNPSNVTSCPNEFHCERSHQFGLHFCCGNDGSTTASTHPNANNNYPTTTTTASLLYTEKPWVNVANIGGDGRPSINERNGGTTPSQQTEICSSISRPFTFEGKPVLCIANDTASCPVGYKCTMHTPTVHFCCRISPPSESSPPFVDVRPTLTPTATASTKIASQTPPVTTATSFRPPPVPVPSIESICGPSSKPYLYEGNPVMCLVNETGNCPFGYVCDLHHPSDAYFCCQRDLTTTTVIASSSSSPSINPLAARAITSPDGCPAQMQAAHDQKGGTQVCDLSLSPDVCPLDTMCLYSVIYGRYQCCGKSGSAGSTSTTPASAKSARKHSLAHVDECPPGQVPYRDPVINETFTCAANHLDSCPGGYFCQWSDPAGKFLCCGVSAGCPSRGVAHVNPATGEVQRCGYPSDSSCPHGYACQRVQNGSYVCCAGGGPLLSTAPRLHPVSFEIGQTGRIHLTTQAPIASATSSTPVPIVQKLCPVGLPLSESGALGKYKTCGEGLQCPSGYDCLPTVAGPVCCTKPEKICALPSESGASSCLNSTNAASSGSRFYYDLLSESCKPFSYNGCDGNLNNFQSLAECELFCSTGLCPRGLALRVHNKAQRCDMSNTGHQCPTGYTCTTPNYGSVSKTVCCPNAGLICNLGPLVGQSCQSGTSTVTRYYYHASLRICRSMAYFGCNGNGNNFETPDECRSFCSNAHLDQQSTTLEPFTILTTPETSPVTTQIFLSPTTSTSQELRCPVFGQVMHTDPNFSSCRPASVYPCPDGFTCQKAVKNHALVPDAFVCCGPPTGSLKSQICPNGTEVYVNAVAKQPTICNPADADACPQGYGCVLSKFMRTFYCCSTSAAHRTLVVEPPPPATNQLLNTMEESDPDCPRGRKPFLYPRTAKPLACLQPTSVCPPSYSCLRSTVANLYLCCSTEKKESAEVSPNNGGSFMPPNPFIQRGMVAQPFSNGFNERSSWASAKSPSSMGGQWVPTADEAQWPHRAATFESESNLPYGQVQILNTEPVQPLAMPLSLFVPNRKREIEATESITSIYCNVTRKRQLGRECCAHEQCLHHCGSFKGQRFCVCPRHRLLDLTVDPPRCSSSCDHWRSGAFCLPENPETNPFSAHHDQQQPKIVQRRRVQPRMVSRTFNRRHHVRT